MEGEVRWHGSLRCSEAEVSGSTEHTVEEAGCLSEIDVGDSKKNWMKVGAQVDRTNVCGTVTLPCQGPTSQLETAHQMKILSDNEGKIEVTLLIQHAGKLRFF